MLVVDTNVLVGVLLQRCSPHRGLVSSLLLKDTRRSPGKSWWSFLTSQAICSTTSCSNAVYPSRHFIRAYNFRRGPARLNKKIVILNAGRTSTASEAKRRTCFAKVPSLKAGPSLTLPRALGRGKFFENQPFRRHS